MGRCARAAWDHAVEQHQASTVARPGVTTGHLLLGVLRQEACAGGLILARMQLDVKLAYATTEFVLLHGRPQGESAGRTADWAGVPHSVAARETLDLALEEANLFRPDYPIGTEHLLLGILRVPEALGCRILHYFGLEVHGARAVRDQLWDLLRGSE